MCQRECVQTVRHCQTRFRSSLFGWDQETVSNRQYPVVWLCVCVSECTCTCLCGCAECVFCNIRVHACLTSTDSIIREWGCSLMFSLRFTVLILLNHVAGERTVLKSSCINVLDMPFYMYGRVFIPLFCFSFAKMNLEKKNIHIPWLSGGVETTSTCCHFWFNPFLDVVKCQFSGCECTELCSRLVNTSILCPCHEPYVRCVRMHTQN